MATIALQTMRFYAHHGCFEEERKIGTHFIVDLSFETDTTRAQLSDDINDTVNYLSVYQTVKVVMAQSSHLLEHVADNIGREVLALYPPIESLTVKVTKCHPPLGGDLEGVSVTLTMKR